MLLAKNVVVSLTLPSVTATLVTSTPSTLAQQWSGIIIGSVVTAVCFVGLAVALAVRSWTWKRKQEKQRYLMRDHYQQPKMSEPEPPEMVEHYLDYVVVAEGDDESDEPLFVKRADSFEESRGGRVIIEIEEEEEDEDEDVFVRRGGDGEEGVLIEESTESISVTVSTVTSEHE